MICLAPVFDPYLNIVSDQLSDEMQDLFKVMGAEMMGGIDKARIEDFIELKKKYGKPIVAIGFLTQREPESVKPLEKNGIPVYETPDQAAHVLFKLIEYAEYLRAQRSI